MVLQDVEDVIGGYSGQSRTVLEYSVVIKRLVDEAKKPAFSVEGWAPLADLIAVDEFERVGPFKEVMNWDDYVKFLANWAASSEWDCSFRRVTKVSDLVFLELKNATSWVTSATSLTRCRSTSSTAPERSGASLSTCKWSCLKVTC